MPSLQQAGSALYISFNSIFFYAHCRIGRDVLRSPGALPLRLRPLLAQDLFDIESAEICSIELLFILRFFGIRFRSPVTE